MRSVNNGRYIRWTQLGNLSDINRLLISVKICLRACWLITTSVALLDSSRNALFSQDNLIVFPLMISAGGKNLSNYSQSETKSSDMTPVIGSPSIGRPNSNATSSRVVVHTPRKKMKCMCFCSPSFN